MSQHPQQVVLAGDPPPYSPRIVDSPLPCEPPSELPPVELRELRRPSPVHLEQTPVALNRHSITDEEANGYLDESHPPSYIPPYGKEEHDIAIVHRARPARRNRSGCCSRKCCTIVFFLLVVAVGLPVGYIMAKKAQFDERKAAGH